MFLSNIHISLHDFYHNSIDFYMIIIYYTGIVIAENFHVLIPLFLAVNAFKRLLSCVLVISTYYMNIS